MKGPKFTPFLIACFFTLALPAQEPGALLWEFAPNGSVTHPAIADDGTIYFTSALGRVYALDSAGSLKWEVQLPDTHGFRSAPIVGADSSIYVSSQRNLYAIKDDGTLLWSYPAGNLSAVGKDRSLYLSFANDIIALNPDGSEKWKSSMFYPGSSLITDSDGTIYFAGSPRNRSSTYSLFALDEKGTVLRNMPVESDGFTSPIVSSIGNNGTVYGAHGIHYSDLCAIKQTGAKKWQVLVNSGISGPAIGADGTLYVGTYNQEDSGSLGYFYALNSDGTEKWKISMFLFSTFPAVAEDGTIYTTSGDSLIAVNENGSRRWQFTPGARLLSPPSIASDGTLYFSSGVDGPLTVPSEVKFYAVKGSSGLADSPWPKYRGNAKNTNSAQPSSKEASINLPDLIIENVSFTPSDVEAGELVLVDFLVRNTGIGNAIATEARLRLSADSTLTLNDWPLAPLDVGIPSLEPQESYSFSGLFKVPANLPSGRYYVGAFADWDSRANQTDETNDTRLSTEPLRIGIVFDSVSYTPPTPESTAKTFGFSFRTKPIHEYVIEYKDSLFAPTWGFLKTVTGNGNSSYYYDTSLLPSSRFYRIRKLAEPTSTFNLKFPLDGSYSVERINRDGGEGDFGDHWQESYCIAEEHKNHRLLHTGIDLSAKAEDIVYAAAKGQIKYAEADVTWGGYVVIEHEGQYTTTYTHVIPKDAIEPGGPIEKGEPIGAIAPGITGIFKAHLHFQLRNAPFDAKGSLVGRLPEGEVPCVTKIGENGVERTDVPFPEHFIDPKLVSWE